MLSLKNVFILFCLIIQYPSFASEHPREIPVTRSLLIASIFSHATACGMVCFAVTENPVIALAGTALGCFLGTKQVYHLRCGCNVCKGKDAFEQGYIPSTGTANVILGKLG
jgi:hypothetical protein